MQFLSPVLILGLLMILTLAVYWITNFVIFYHLIRFGIGTQPKKIALIFLLGSITFFFISVMLFAQIDWDVTVKQLVFLIQSLSLTTPML